MFQETPLQEEAKAHPARLSTPQVMTQSLINQASHELRKLPLKNLIKATPPTTKLKISRNSINFFRDPEKKVLRVKLRAVSLSAQKLNQKDVNSKFSSHKTPGPQQKAEMRYQTITDQLILPQTISGDFWTEKKQERTISDDGFGQYSP